MDKNGSFKIKLVSLSSFKCLHPHLYQYKSLPYGMGVLVAFLRNNNYHVEQEDLLIKFYCQGNYFYSFLIFKKLIYTSRFQKEIQRILETGNFKFWLSLIIDKLLDSLCLDGFNLIGFSIGTHAELSLALLLSSRIKQNINIPIVFGGVFVTLYGHLYPEIFNCADYMIIGDGRIPLVKLVDYLDNKISISEVPNLIYKKDGEFKANPRKHYPLEEVPAPDFDGSPLDLYKNYRMKHKNIILPYQITRGCTNRCSFCVYTCIDHKLEFKSYDKVLVELRQMKEKYNSKHFRFCDDTINNSYEYLDGLCDLFIKNKLDIRWSVFARVNNLDKYILMKMKKAGCVALEFGIESGSNDILRRMNKIVTTEEARGILKYSAEAGLLNFVDFIAGFPYETKRDIEETIDFIRKNKEYIHRARVINFFLLYGSSIYFNPERHGITNLIPRKWDRYIFAFDESNGLRWGQKQKQQKTSLKKIKRAINKYINIGFSGVNASLLNRVVMKLKQVL